MVQIMSLILCGLRIFVIILKSFATGSWDYIGGFIS